MLPHEPQPPFVALGAMPMMVLQSAYLEAVRRRAGIVGTLDVLVRVAVHEKRIPSTLLADARGSLARMAAEPHRITARRRAGEFVSASVTEFDSEVQAILREVEWRIRRSARWPLVKRSDVDNWDYQPLWTPGVRAMLAGALAAARDNGIPFASLTHLMLGMLWLADCDGTRHVFLNEYARVAAVEQLSKEPDLCRPDQPHPDLDEVRWAMWPRSESLFDRLAGPFIARMYRLARIGPLFAAVEMEARRQAVRLGHGVVGPAHTLLAMLALDAQLNGARMPVPARHSSRNRGTAVLRRYGVDATRLRDLAAYRSEPEEPPAEMLAKQLQSLRPGDPFDGAETVAAMDRAKEISLAYRHPDTGTSHLLLALIEDDAGDASAILRDLGIDPAPVRGRVEQDLRAAPAAWPSRTG